MTTRSKSFKLSRLWTARHSNSSEEKASAPATPGAFNYYSVNDPGAGRAYQDYARRHTGSAAADSPAPTTLTFPDERYSDESDSGNEEEEEVVVQRRLRGSRRAGDVNDYDEVNAERQEAAARELQLPTRTQREGKRAKSKNCCRTFCSRFSWATFLAFCLCFSGGGIFAVCFKFAADGMMQMQQDVFHISRAWMEGVAIGLTAAGALVMALSALIFALSFVFWPKTPTVGSNTATGEGTTVASTGGIEGRNRRHALMRPASKTPPLVLLLMTYPALPVWLLMVAFTVAFYMCTSIMEGVCNTEEIKPLWDGTVPPWNGDQCKVIGDWEDCADCIDLYQFHFLFPEDTRKEDMWICGTEIKTFCIGYIPDVVHYWLLCFEGSILVVLGVSLHLLALTHERTRLGEERLMQETMDSKYIQNRVSHALLLSASAGSLNNNNSNHNSRRKNKKMKKEAKRQQMRSSSFAAGGSSYR